MAVIGLKEMNDALQRFNRLVAVQDSEQQPSDPRTVMCEYLEVDEEAFELLTIFIEEVGGDGETFMAGVVCGGMILKEAAEGGGLSVVPDAPPPDLAA